MGKPQYTQKFRKEWLQNTLFKDWLVAVEGDDCKGRCRYCKTEVNAKFYDIKQHAKTSKHISATKLLSSSRSLTDFCKPPSIKVNEAEASLSLFIAVHCSILPIDHLGTLCHSTFGDSVAAKDFKLHRTKCTNIIINVFAPHFESSLMQSIGKNPYSILIDESTDISVTKFLGITVIYFDREMGKTISTYLSLVEITNCDAQSITDALKDAIHNKGLQLKNLVGIGTDNASVMVGVNNGVYQKLKLEIPSLILIPCVCHSLQLAVSSAASEVLSSDHELYH
ncbi:uncharacterized protein LOC111031991, partial [Myzus persicae]|uniref:uncharacterized protein LOC111031991 n=1 Tax=Myzus persicae TaxID=13164 RepID=UPI000B930A33